MTWLRKLKNVRMVTTGNVNDTNTHVKFTSIMKRVWAICVVKWRN